jgi:hypothetical protein
MDNIQIKYHDNINTSLSENNVIIFIIFFLIENIWVEHIACMLEVRNG